jgi:F0F1-type ATP synthase delta subunit
VVAEARAESDRIIEQARKNEEKMRQQIAQDMEEKAVDYAGQLFSLVFSEKMMEALDRQFVDELLDALEQVDATSITVDASQVEFTASHPLDPAQKARLESLLAQKFDARVDVVAKVQGDLMAGLIFKLGSLEIDGSLRNRFQEAIAEVKKNTRK